MTLRAITSLVLQLVSVQPDQAVERRYSVSRVSTAQMIRAVRGVLEPVAHRRSLLAIATVARRTGFRSSIFAVQGSTFSGCRRPVEVFRIASAVES